MPLSKQLLTAPPKPQRFVNATLRIFASPPHIPVRRPFDRSAVGPRTCATDPRELPNGTQHTQPPQSTDPARPHAAKLHAISPPSSAAPAMRFPRTRRQHRRSLHDVCCAFGALSLPLSLAVVRQLSRTSAVLCAVRDGAVLKPSKPFAAAASCSEPHRDYV